MKFAAEYPALVDPSTGLPRTWRAFLYGIGEVGRERARDAIMIASAAGVHRMNKPDRDEWYRDQKHAAGW